MNYFSTDLKHLSPNNDDELIAVAAGSFIVGFAFAVFALIALAAA